MSLFIDEIPPDVISPHEVDPKSTLDQPLKHLDTVIALYDFPGTQASHLPLNLGDTVYVLSKSPTGWWDGVVLSQNGEILRGWFPHNYVRSVNYVQPVLNQLKSNKELDSITAANTAANVLIPSFTNLLQKNFFDSERNSPSNSVRKNSVVSFASSETSIPSDSKNSNPGNSTSLASTPMSSQPQLQLIPMSSNQSSFSQMVPANDEIVFTPVADAERLLEDYKVSHNRNLAWLPRFTNGGDIVYYCEQLGIYCELLPLSPFIPEIDTEVGNIEFPSSTLISNNSIIIRDSELNDHDRNSGDDRKHSSSGKSFDPLKRDSNAYSVNSQSSGASSYHHFSQPFFSLKGLFYNHPTDLTYWTEMREKFNYLLDLSHKALKDNNKQLYSTHFNRLTKLVSVVASASRLIQQDFVGTDYERSVRRKLKRIASSYAQLYINGILHLSVMHYSQNTPDSELFSIDISKLNKSTSLTADMSNSSSLSSNPELNDLNCDSSSNKFNQFNFKDSSLNDKDDDYISYIQQIDIEVEILRTNMNSLTKIFLKLTRDKKVRKSDYDASDTSDEESGGEDRYNVLPQVYPRFLVDEFNGGNWCNPFFSTKNLVLNASGDDLKNRYHLKVIIDRDAYNSIKESIDVMKALSKETLDYLDPEVQDKYFNAILKNERNTQVLKLIYKFLFYAGATIDTIESFDFTVFSLIKKTGSLEENNMTGTNKHFASPKTDKDDEIADDLNTYKDLNNDNSTTEPTSSLTFDYPVVLEFFQFKQQFHNLISNIVMSTQSLTVQDPDVFKGMKEEDPLFYNRNILKIPTEKAALVLANILANQTIHSKGDSISLNPDTLMSSILKDGIKFFDSILKIIQQLIEERETILNYATRVMHDDFNVQLLLIERNNTILSERSEEGPLFYTAKKQSNDVPWYLEGDEEYDLLLDVKGNIKGGTKEALIAHLTHHDLFDSNFNTAFLLTFATIMSIGEFINLLITRFNIEAPEGLSYEEYNNWITKKQNPIKLRVMNIMKLLVEKHWSKSYYNEPVIKNWLKFAQTPPVQAFSIGKILSNDLQRLLKGEILAREREPSIPDHKPPAPLTKSFSMKKIKLLDIDYIELARQLTLMEFNYYSKITKFACLTKVWGKKSGLNEKVEPISNFIKASNQLTTFVAYMILRKADVKKRVQIIRYFVQVAEKCRQYNNFSSMTAIISALYSSPIHRLKKTWKYVSSDTLAQLQNMNKLMNSSRNFNEYRDLLKFVGSEPCVPFFGVYLSDLTFVFHGNPDYLMNRPRMINFAKRAKTCEIVLGIDRFKSMGYNLQPVPEIQKYLDLWFGQCPSIEEQYQISLNLEPRETVQAEAGSTSHTSRLVKSSLGAFSFKQ